MHKRRGMRATKFRGKFEGTWWYVRASNDHISSSWEQFWALVDRETVGEYVGDKDKSGKEIYEGDIVRHSNGIDLTRIEDIHAFCGDNSIYVDYANDVEITGHIY